MTNVDTYVGVLADVGLVEKLERPLVVNLLVIDHWLLVYSHLVFVNWLRLVILDWGLVMLYWGLVRFDWGLVRLDWGLVRLTWGLGRLNWGLVWLNWGLVRVFFVVGTVDIEPRLSVVGDLWNIHVHSNLGQDGGGKEWQQRKHTHFVQACYFAQAFGRVVEAVPVMDVCAR